MDSRWPALPAQPAASAKVPAHPRQGWTVRNGTIANWQNSAIFAQHVNNSTFEDLSLAGNGISGSQALLAGGAITVHNVKATGNHGSGISLGAVGQVSDCFVDVFFPNTAGIIGADQSTIRDCTVTGNAASATTGISAGPERGVQQHRQGCGRNRDQRGHREHRDRLCRGWERRQRDPGD